jgi:hypothetical protein
MNGFERADWSAAWPDAEEPTFPDDFTADEAAFAHELRTWYAVERDEAPPLYAQTLLGCDRPEMAEPGFEQRVLYSVSRRLALPRPSLIDGAPALAWLRTAGRSIVDAVFAIPRTVAATGGAIMAIMALTMMVASPSFATGLRILLGGTGVQQVTSYPAHVQGPSSRVDRSGKPQPLGTPDPNAPVYWIGESFGGFTFAGIRELAQPSWAQGPLLDLTYIADTTGRVATDTTAVLNIREFQISDANSAVLQMVQAGYATAVTAGDEQAVYINGSWMGALDNAHLGTSAVWTPGQKSELILEYAGVIFWITGDQRYGIDEAALVNVAKHFLVAQVSQLTPHVQLTRLAGQELQAALADPGAEEIVSVVPAGQPLSSGTASFVTIAANTSGK